MSSIHIQTVLSILYIHAINYTVRIQLQIVVWHNINYTLSIQHTLCTTGTKMTTVEYIFTSSDSHAGLGSCVTRATSSHVRQWAVRPEQDSVDEDNCSHGVSTGRGRDVIRHLPSGRTELRGRHDGTCHLQDPRHRQQGHSSL